MELACCSKIRVVFDLYAGFHFRGNDPCNSSKDNYLRVVALLSCDKELYGAQQEGAKHVAKLVKHRNEDVSISRKVDFLFIHEISIGFLYGVDGIQSFLSSR